MAKPTPPLSEIIAAAANHRYSNNYNAFGFEHVRLIVQRAFGTNSTYARTWLRAALADPEQSELVMLESRDDKTVVRLVAHPDKPGRVVAVPVDVATYAPRDQLARVLPPLYLDSSGGYVEAKDKAVRNQDWVIRRSTLDDYVNKLAARRDAEDAEQAAEQAAEDAETEEIMGDALSLVRGMLAAAGIALVRKNHRKKITAWTVKAQVDDGTERIGKFLGTELRNADVDKLRDWLASVGVEPVGPDGQPHPADAQ